MQGVYFWFTNDCLASHAKLWWYNKQGLIMNSPPTWWPSQTLGITHCVYQKWKPERNGHERYFLSRGILLAKWKQCSASLWWVWKHRAGVILTIITFINRLDSSILMYENPKMALEFFFYDRAIIFFFGQIPPRNPPWWHSPNTLNATPSIGMHCFWHSFNIRIIIQPYPSKK